ITGVILGFKEKLAEQKVVCQQEGLIWVGDSDLTKYFHKRHPRIRMMYGRIIEMSNAHMAGVDAGRQIVLHRPVASSNESAGRLLES
ncbi:MAG: DUF2786 domain-containing protein, partial [Pseudomonadota bacterium]